MKMKPEPENETPREDSSASIAGDVIGDTAYSERFVLKILLKLANRDTLQHELSEPTFEEELCTLWDMTAERDVVLYLQKHDALNLFAFAAPLITSDRINEVVIGTLANMCCQKEAVDSLMNNDNLLELLFKLFSQDDSQVFIQLIRLVNSCLYIADESQLSIWMDKFSEYNYASTLYFILKNSLNKELLMTALENLNTICANCQTEQLGDKFNEMFVMEDAPQSVYLAHCEYRKQANIDENLERLHLITLQMVLHLTKTEIVNEGNENMTFDNSEHAINLVHDILTSSESRITEFGLIDTEFVNVLDAAKLFIQYLDASKCSPDKYFTPSYKMWKALIPCRREKNNEASKELVEETKNILALIMCTYMAKCTDNNLMRVLDDIGNDYGHIVSRLSNAEMQATVENRTLNYRNTFNRNTDI